ncbi:MAG: 2-dehydro-3-deoxyphosphooctonate aldolase (KDO 8-P synthase), partial [Candidatus Binatia bacterium]
MSIHPFQLGPDGARITVGDGELFLIAGPCVIESRDSSLRHAEQLKAISAQTGVPIIFKSSFDKANRTSHASFRGPGPDEGLRILAEVRTELGMAVLTDVHENDQCAATAEVADVLQIPALLCRQTDLIAAATRTGKVVNIKKGQFLAPWDMEHVLGKAREAGGERVILTERGTTFGYGNLVNDFRSLDIMRAFGAPVVFDATHSVQLPGAGGSVSAGQRQFVAPLSRAAVAVGVDGLFMEVHENPDEALSDGPNSLALADLAG